MSRPEAIVWDLDGTLVDSAADLAHALNTLLGKCGFAGYSVDTVRSMIGHGVPALLKSGFGLAGLPLKTDQLEQMLPVFMQHYYACATHKTRAYHGIFGILEHLQQWGIPMGVCTNKPETVSRQILHSLGLAKYFRSIIGGDSTSASKPDPLPILTCLRALGGRASSSLVIGDSEVDVSTARAANIPVAIVNWGYTKTPLRQLNADLVITGPADLYTFTDTTITVH